ARRHRLRVVPLASVVPRPDAAALMRVSDEFDRPRAVILCSSADAPDIVRRAMDRARRAKALLPPAQGRHILDPLAEGRWRGLSYAVLPHCAELATWRFAWRVQRELLAPLLFDWLWQVNAATLRDVPDNEQDRFAQPLKVLGSVEALSDRVRSDALHAADRLQAGTWRPKTVLMHGDLWKGNLLLRPPTGALDSLQWRERFIVIDWPGSQSRGHAIYDLVRLAQSMRLGDTRLRAEVQRHCDLLGCRREDAISHLLAALGHMAMHLEHFPMQMFTTMAEACHATLARAID
ncbi:MAG TPA: hypothetical protein VGP22_06890, partial [Albitalea sp.]|nr:hypothetical protein [Albitalea sp.]